MAKLVALIALIAAMFLNGLGNFWFTYGIWPRSWGAFFLFFTTGVILHLLLGAVMKEK